MNARSVVFVMCLMLAWTAQATAQQLKWNDNEEIRAAVIDAGTRLQKPKCAEIFGVDGSKALVDAHYRAFSTGAPRRLSNGTVQLINAVTIPESNLIIFNTDGAFFNPRLQVDGLYFNLGLSDRDLRALVVLHELGHLIGVFDHDGSDPLLSRQYTERIREGCF